MPFTLRDAVAEVRRWVGQHARPPAEALPALWPSLRRKLSAADLDTLAQQGLRNAVNDQMHVERNVTRPQYLQVVVEQQPDTRPQDVTIFAAFTYVTSSGDTKLLLDITPDDCTYVAADLRASANGMLRRAAFFDMAREVMMARNASSLRELPVRVRRDLEEKWPVDQA